MATAKTPQEPRKFAPIAWTASDVKLKRPRWSKAKCEEFLLDNASHLQDRLVEYGWEVMDTLISIYEAEHK